MNVFEVVFHVWTANIVRFYARMDSFHRKNYNAKERKQIEQNHYAVAIVKRTTGCTENHGSWLWAN